MNVSAHRAFGLMKELAFERVSCSEAERRAAERLLAEAQAAGLQAHLEEFTVKCGRVSHARLTVTEPFRKEFEVTGYERAASTPAGGVELPFYYAENVTDVHLAQVKGCAVLINGRLRRAGRPLVLWGCSVEPDIIKGETLCDLRAYDLIVARESITEEAMRAAGLPVVRWCDPAFTMACEELPLPDGWREGKTVGLNVSPLILSRAKDGERTLDAFAGLVRHILESSDCAVALIPHVFWAHDNDLDALGRIKARFENEPRVFLLPQAGTLTAPQIKGYIARLAALVTARTHASVAGYSTGVPTLVIGYSVKARGIARDLFGDEAGHLIPVQELDGETELIAAYEAMTARAQEERAFLTARMPAYTAGREDIVARVMKLAK